MNATDHPIRSAHASSTFARRSVLALTAMFVAVSACQRDGSTVTAPNDSTALSRGAGGAGSSTVEVTSVSPTEAPTDTVLDVVVNGKGFARGAAAKWSIAGDTTKVHVLSTTFVNPGQLKARLQVPANAPTGSYDVEVYLVDGKKGVGAELFLVKGKQPVQTSVSANFSVPASGTNFTSVGDTLYADGVCSVIGKVFVLDGVYEDGNLQLDQASAKGKPCGPRTRITTYPATSSRAAVADTATGGMNVGLMGTVTVDSGTVQRPMNIAINARTSYCTRLAFGNAFGAPYGATKVNVTRVSATKWKIESLAGGSKAACERPSGQVELIEGFVLSFTVTLN